VIRGFGHGGKQIIPILDQIRRIQGRLPIVFSSLPEAKTLDSLVTGEPTASAHIGH
jgi:hypothetical protein